MAGILKRARRQFAIYWSQQSGPGEYGQRAFNNPVEIRCRWDDVQKEVRNAQGETVMSSADVIVDRDMKPGDMLELGHLDSSTPNDPLDSGSAAVEIAAMSRIPPLRRGEPAIIAHMSAGNTATA